MIEQLCLQDRVRITGYLSNQGVLEELVAARELVLPSFAEGLPAVFFEALALGRPVISTYIAAHPELIEPGVNGWLVPAGAVEPLVDAMAEALTSDVAVLEKMGRAGATRVAEQHNVYTEVQKLIDLFLPGSSAQVQQSPSPRASAPRRDMMVVSRGSCIKSVSRH